MKEEERLVSVIIPVYNAMDTLYFCIDSLYAQTYTQLELLFVDDCSTDKSLEIINNCINDYSGKTIIQAKILRHEVNRGVAAARNTGLESASGVYVYYVDADDWVEPDCLKLLVTEAQRKEADVVGCEWYLAFNNNERYMKQADIISPEDALMQMMCGGLRWNLWLYLVRRSLYEENQIRFIEGQNMGEDMMVMIKLLVCASSVALIHRPLYHYNQVNLHSLTKIYSAGHVNEVTANVSEVEEFIHNKGLNQTLERYVCFLKLNIKLPLLITDNVRHYQQWQKWFPEADSYIVQNKRQAFRTRMLQWFVYKDLFFPAKLYYHMAVKFIYGVIYK